MSEEQPHTPFFNTKGTKELRKSWK